MAVTDFAVAIPDAERLPPTRRRPIYLTALATTHNNDGAKYLVQETLPWVFAAFRQFAPSTYLAAWPYRMLTNTFRMPTATYVCGLYRGHRRLRGLLTGYAADRGR